MAIKKRTSYAKFKTIVKLYRVGSEPRTITAQYIHEIYVREAREGVTAQALIGGEWFEAEKIDPEKRGGCEYEVYKEDHTSQASEETPADPEPFNRY